MFKRLMCTLATALVMLSGAVSAPAFALPPVWASVGAGCVPTGQTSQFDRHFQTAGRTNFNVGKTGEIILTCPINHRLGSANGMQVLYADPDGQGTNARVLVALRKMHRATGAVSTVASFDSNMFPQTAFGKAGTILNGCNNFVFDHENFYYYVQMNMTRTSVALPVSFGAVELASVVIIC